MDSESVFVRWGGAHSARAARSALRKGKTVEIALPPAHHALHRHVRPGAPPAMADALEADGGAELLERIATVAGLEGLARLVSPEPRLMLSPVGD